MKISVRTSLSVFCLASASALLAACSPGVMMAGGATAAAVYYEDDLVFQASDEPFGKNQFQITVSKTRFIGSRSGELWQIFKRRAAYIVEREGCSGYTVLEYTEGNEAAVVAGNRVGRGTIACKAMPAKS